MSSCSNCAYVDPIEDAGAVLLRSERADLKEKARDLLVRHGIAYDDANDLLLLPYETKDALLSLLHTVKESFEPRETELLQFGVRPEGSRRGGLPALSSLSQFLSMMKHHDLVDIIQQAHFASHMQPIVELRSMSTFGYEFMLRAAPESKPFQPYELFRVAQETGLHSFLDRQARISAIETSAKHLPNGMKRFINFLPSSIYNPNYCLSHTFFAIERLKLDPNDFVFEVVETERIVDVKHLQSIFDVYKKEGMKVALDDVGSGFATVEVLSQLRPDIVKIDRGLVDGCDTDEAKQRNIQSILDASRDIGAKVLGEGIERKEELAFLSSLGVDYAQGYLFAKPGPVPAEAADWRFVE
ncbi:EAL domain-containing protein [Paenibacillus sp. TRM 82003]|nr:EAL domain-containing protein [Paenibacillus sp. TRM 82003]